MEKRAKGHKKPPRTAISSSKYVCTQHISIHENETERIKITEKHNNILVIHYK